MFVLADRVVKDVECKGMLDVGRIKVYRVVDASGWDVVEDMLNACAVGVYKGYPSSGDDVLKSTVFSER